MAKPWMVSGIRGRNGSDPPALIPDDMCCEALNVEFTTGGLARRRAGSLSTSLTGIVFSGGLVTLLRHLPDEDETDAELWAVDSGTGKIGRLAGGVTWSTPSLSNVVGSFPQEVTGASLGGKFWLTYASSVNRSFVWDGSTVRKRGFATAAAPTVATTGGAGNTFTRFYRIRWAEISGTDRVRQSEPSTSVTMSITDDASVRVTRPVVLGEGETHWIVEYADADAGPWYEVTTVAVATTFYDDADASVDTTLPLSDEDGTHLPPPAFKWTVKAGGRLLQGGQWTSTAGDSFVPLKNEVYWSPVEGELDVGDLERQPTNYRVVLDHVLNGLSEPLNGVSYAFGYRGISSLVQTDATGEGAFRRITERLDLGCIRHQTILTADDEFGRQCVYFLSHRGPYRIGPSGMQYLGADIEDVWEDINLDASQIAGHGTYYADKRQIYWWISTGSAAYPNTRLRFHTDLGTTQGGEVRGGWVVDDGDAASAACSVSFSTTIGASMSRALKPYFGSTLALGLFKADTGTVDGTTPYRAYLDTKEYAPAGLGRNCDVREPYLLAESSDTATIAVELRADFGRLELPIGYLSLAPDQNETHVLRRISGLENAGFGTLRMRIGDATEIDTDWTLDAIVAHYEPQEPR